jgi:hypothetical protein
MDKVRLTDAVEPNLDETVVFASVDLVISFLRDNVLESF